MPTYEFLCGTCDTITEEHYKMAERPAEIPCPTCDGVAKYKISIPMLVIKEAYVDGTKRKGWDSMREASKLNKEQAEARTADDRQRIAGEIRKLGVKVKQ